MSDWAWLSPYLLLVAGCVLLFAWPQARATIKFIFIEFVDLVILIGGALFAGLNGNNFLAGLLLTTAVLCGAARFIKGRMRK